MQEMQEIQVRSLCWEVLLEKKIATHSNILAWRVLWTEEPGGDSPWGLRESGMIEQLTLTSLHSIS